ncbi:MAG: nucleotidyltransferase domain-containing protein, partial [Candidatus Binataceae bacterium]
MAGSPERSRELSFLLGCCAPNPARASLELPGVDFDWSWLEAAARWHGVIPLVARQLARLDGSSNPIRQRIMTHATANALRNQYLASRLIDLMREFSQSAIAALAIKGPMLAQIAYGDAGLRMFADLDVLVHQADVPRAARLLGELGFSPDNYDEAAFRSDFFHTVEVNFRARDGDVNLDLHWDLSPGYYPFGPPGDALWDRATVATFCATPVLTLAPEDHLLYLVVHASRHGWPVLSQICDIAHLASRVKLDWATLRDR